MEIGIQNLKRCELITLSGEIDAANAPTLEQALLDLIEAGKRNLVLNLRDVTFISSSGIKTLLSAQITLRRRVPQGEVVICEIPPTIRQTLEMVGLHHLFQLYDQDAQAVGSF